MSAVDAESVPDQCGRFERRTGKRGVRYGDVAVRSIEVEEVEDIGILAGRHEDPVGADGGKLSEVLIP